MKKTILLGITLLAMVLVFLSGCQSNQSDTRNIQESEQTSEESSTSEETSTSEESSTSEETSTGEETAQSEMVKVNMDYLMDFIGKTLGEVGASGIEGEVGLDASNQFMYEYSDLLNTFQYRFTQLDDDDKIDGVWINLFVVDENIIPPVNEISLFGIVLNSSDIDALIEEFGQPSFKDDEGMVALVDDKIIYVRIHPTGVIDLIGVYANTTENYNQISKLFDLN